MGFLCFQLGVALNITIRHIKKLLMKNSHQQFSI